MSKLTAAEQMLYSTVKVTTVSKGVVTGSGTGFFYKVTVDDSYAMLLVTNKHVAKGADEFRLLLHEGTGDPNDGPTGQVFTCSLQLVPGAEFDHPDPAVDLCAHSVVGLIESIAESGKHVFLVNLASSNIPANDDWENFDAIEDVTMVGCPRGIFDEKNNIPIARRGITATPLGKKYEGNDQFVVDMACFPGSSGSPIFVYDRNGFLDRKQNTYQIGAQRVFFVGVLFAGPVITNAGKIVMGQPTEVQVATAMHLGYAVRSTAMHAIEDLLRKRVGAS